MRILAVLAKVGVVLAVYMRWVCPYELRRGAKDEEVGYHCNLIPVFAQAS